MTLGIKATSIMPIIKTTHYMTAVSIMAHGIIILCIRMLSIMTLSITNLITTYFPLNKHLHYGLDVGH
jgi:hypothetical protein